MSSFMYYDPNLNYENLEVVGDSLLKVITTIHLYNIYQSKNEKTLT